MVIRILLIDDEEAHLEIAKVFLEQEQGFKVDTSLSAQEALDRLKRERFDVIISDYQMPGMNGIELLKTLKSAGDTTPYILFTGRGREDVAIDALNNGASFYLQKGGDATSQFAELVNMIETSARQSRAEKALLQEKDRAQQYINLAGVMLLALDKHGKVTLINKKGCEILGYEEDQILGKSWFENFLRERCRDEVKVIFNGLMRGELGPLDHQPSFPVLCKGGAERRIAFTNAHLKNEEGEIVGTLSSGEDVTERELAEDALRVGLAKYTTLFESLPLGVTISDKEGNIVESNRDAERLLGLSREDQVKRQIDGREWRIVRRDGSPMPASEYASVRAMKENRLVSDVEMGIVKDDGPPTWINVTAAPIPLAGYGVAIVYNDITERKLAEEMLRKSEDKYRQLVELAQEGVWVIDADANTTYVNPRMAEMLGYTSGEMMGRPIFAFMDERGKKTAQMALGRRQGIHEHHDFEFLRKDGQRIYASLETSPLMDEAGNYTGYMAVVADITERKRTEDALRESEKRYRLLVDSAAEAIIVAQDGMIRVVNPMTIAITGLSEQELMSKPFPAFVHPDDRAMVVDTYQRRLRGEAVPARYAFRLLAKDGIIKWMEVSAVAIDWEGRPATLNFLTDITERRKSEVVIAESLEKRRELESIIDKSPAIAFIWKHVPEWSVVFVSSNIKQFGYMPEDFTSRRLTYADLVHPEDMKRVFGESEAYAKKGVSEFTQEYRILTKSGDVRWVDDRTVILRNTAGESVFHQGIIFDITEQRRAERALRQANEKLSLLGSITRHDAINQLSVLMAWLDIAKEVGKDLPIMDQLTRVQESARILQRQLEFTAEYQEMGVKQPQWINLRDAADAGTEGIDLGAVSIKYDLKGAEIFADPMLEKMFHNLVDNSLRHGEKVTQIRLYCKESNEGLVIICEDDGAGVPVDEKERIFERGFGKHMGLGLYLVREILGITGIVVKETGEPGTGARFEVLVPAGNYRFGHPGQ